MRKVRTGIIGLGRLGYTHARNLAFAIPQAELIAACSLRPEELQKAEAELGVKFCYTDIDSMLKNDALEALIIASTSEEHVAHIKKGLEAGLHVFCEKPLGLNLQECQEAEAVVAQYPDQVFMLGFMRRYDPSYQYAYQKIKEGYIGKAILFRSYSVDPVQTIEGTLAYLPYSAGQFMDMTIHDIDLACWMLGSKPKSIHAIGGCYAYEDFAQYNDGDNVATLMQFENDAMVFLYSGRAAPHGYNIETEIIGTKATLRIGSVPQKNLVELIDNSGIRKECMKHFPERFSQAFLTEMQVFIQCIIQNKKPEVTVYDGTQATHIAMLATKSFQENELIKINQYQ